MTMPRWAQLEEFTPSEMILGRTPDGRPAFWAAIVTRGPRGTNLPEEMVALGEPRAGAKGLATAITLDSWRSAYHSSPMDLTWSWRREEGIVTLMKHGIEYTRLREPSS